MKASPREPFLGAVVELVRPKKSGRQKIIETTKMRVGSWTERGESRFGVGDDDLEGREPFSTDFDATTRLIGMKCIASTPDTELYLYQSPLSIQVRHLTNWITVEIPAGILVGTFAETTTRVKLTFQTRFPA